MKLLFTIIVLLLSINIYSQSGPTPIPKLPQNLGAKGTKVIVKDQLKVDSVLSAEIIRTKTLISDTTYEPDFEIVVLPDLQYQTLTGTPPGPRADSNLVGGTFNWICANKIPANIKLVIQVGDLTDDGHTTQFARVDSNFDKLDNNNIPYLYVPGNHDYAGGIPTDSRVLTQYDVWMGPSRYTGFPYYGGNYLGTNANYYIKIDVGKRRFLVLGLEFEPRNAAVAWAQGILDANTDRESIIVTHGLITQWGEKAQDTSIATNYGLTDNNNGVELWNSLIRKNKQIIMAINGHYVGCCGGSATLTNTNLGPFMEQRLTQTGDNGNIVHMLGYNHQSDSLGGAGQIMRLQFKPSLAKIDVKFFNTRYQGTDPRSTNYSLFYPPIRVEGSLGVRDQFDVAGEATFDNSLKIPLLPKYRPVITDYNGKLDSIDGIADSSKIVVMQGINKRPKLDTLPGNSNAYIRNQIAAAQAANFWINGKGVMGTQTSYQSTLGGSPIAGAVTQGNGNFGFSIQRAGGINQSGPHLSFYHNGGSNFVGTPVPTQGAWELGNINWFGVSLDSVIRRSMYIRGRVEAVGSNFVSCALRFDGFDNSGVDRTRMFISPSGNISIGGTTSNTYRLEVTGAVYGGDSVRFSRLAGSNDVLTGTNNVGSFKKVILGTGLSFNPTGDTLNSSGGSGMAIGGTITSATEGSVLFAGPSGVLAQDNANLFFNNTTNRLGIGESNPQSPLHIFDASNAAIALSNTTATDNGFAIAYTLPNVYLYNRANGFIELATNNTPRVRIDATGNTTFGTTTAIVGTATNNNAAAGNIGEEFSSTVSTYTNYSSSATYQNIASIPLTAGDWDITAQGTFSSNTATITAASDAIFVISTTTASASGAIEGKNISYIPQAALLGTSHESITIAPYKVSISGSTTYYLNTQATFTVGNPQFVGTIRARRAR